MVTTLYFDIISWPLSSMAASGEPSMSDDFLYDNIFAQTSVATVFNNTTRNIQTSTYRGHCPRQPHNAEIFFCKNHGDQRVIRNNHLLVSSFRFVWIPMLRVYGHYNFFNSFNAGVVFRRQILTSKDGLRAERSKPANMRRWAGVVDGGPTLTQHCVNVSFLLGRPP